MARLVCPNCRMPLEDPETCNYCDWKRVPGSDPKAIERPSECPGTSSAQVSSAHVRAEPSTPAI